MISKHATERAQEVAAAIEARRGKTTAQLVAALIGVEFNVLQLHKMIHEDVDEDGLCIGVTATAVSCEAVMEALIEMGVVNPIDLESIRKALQSDIKDIPHNKEH